MGNKYDCSNTVAFGRNKLKVDIFSKLQKKRRLWND